MLPGVGIVGNGRLVSFLVPCLRAKGFNVEAIWSFNLDSAKETADRLDIPFATDSVDQLLLKKEVQLVVVACPPHLHAMVVSKAFNIGKHVVCGWPASLSASEMKDMVERATYYPSLISILAHPLRFVGAIKRLRELINHSCDGDNLSSYHKRTMNGSTSFSNGSPIKTTLFKNSEQPSTLSPTQSSSIGPIKMIEVNISGDILTRLGDLYTVKCDHNMGGGLLTNVGSHIVDTISFLTSLRAKRVNGTLRTLSPLNSSPSKKNGQISRITVDDYCSFQMELDTPLDASPTSKTPILVSVVINSNIIGKYSHEIKLMGSKGYLILKGSSLYVYRYPNLNNRNSSPPSKDSSLTPTNSPNKTPTKPMRQNGDNRPIINQDGEELIFEDMDETLNALNLNSNLPSPYDQGMVKLISTLSNAFIEGNNQSSNTTATINSHSNIVSEEVVPDSSYSSATSSLNSAPDDPKDGNGVIKSASSSTVNSDSKDSGMFVNYWVKDAVNTAASFEDGEYIQAVIEAVKLSSERKEWVRVKYNSPFGPNSPARKNKINSLLKK